MQEAALELLRTETASWFSQVPEPPMYRRLNDPARKRSEELLPQGQTLLTRAREVSRADAARATVAPIIAALEAHLASLSHTVEGRLEEAEREWSRAVELELAIGRESRLWTRSDEEVRPVFDSKTRVSRYDPGAEPTITVKLVCPNRACQNQERFRCSPRYSTHKFVCPRCRKPFVGYFGELRAKEVERRPGGARYLFKIEELNGTPAQVEFEDRTGAEFIVARRDLLAFLYDKDRDLKAVLNLSSGRLLWLRRRGPCFIVSAAYGEDAEQLEAFRAFRDRVLLPNLLGRAAVRTYYVVGPFLAGAVRSSPAARAQLRRTLDGMHRWLVMKGYR